MSATSIGRVLPSRTLVVAVVAVTVAVVVVVFGWRAYEKWSTTSLSAYFENSNGIYVGDNVKLLGVDVGKIDAIEPEGDRTRVDFHVDSQYKLPADARAVILSPSLVSSRSVQLTPAYTGGDALEDGDSIPIEHTAVPVEWDDFRKQLQNLSESFGPTETNADGAIGEFIHSAAQTLNGKGDQINTTLTKLSDAMTALSDGRHDLFATIRNLQEFVTALSASEQQIVALNTNLASVSGALTDSDQELGNALGQVDTVTARIGKFVNENRDGLSRTVEDLSAVTTTLNENRPALEQLLHAAPTAFQNLYNIYQPAQGSLTGALAVTQFQNPVQFICGAIQAASQLGAEESAKLCVQHLAPVLQLLQFNYPPVGVNPAAGVQVRPEQIDYSEPGLRGTVPTPENTRTVNSANGLSGLLGLPTPNGQEESGR
ncbi:MCE family protein [Rhodococcus sp. NPDC127530]|uniref:MCE family protein n=1 Tax=unclassified Rhodococcus (in: high G+C Gram-positive bacteria) TaxID=192944 RepID=UPI003639C54A